MEEHEINVILSILLYLYIVHICVNIYELNYCIYALFCLTFYWHFTKTRAVKIAGEFGLYQFTPPMIQYGAVHFHFWNHSERVFPLPLAVILKDHV
jgi:hypothetical protein